MLRTTSRTPHLKQDGETMTPKEQYEARKAERKKLENMDLQFKQRTESLMLLDMLDRFVVAVECIADTLERDQLYKYSRPVMPQSTKPVDLSRGFCGHGVRLNATCEACVQEFAPTATA